MKRWLAGIILVSLAALMIPVALVRAAPPAAVYFPQTGHQVAAPFLDYWRANGGLQVYGYPLTEAITQTLEDGKPYTVQYFERARMEKHPELPDPNTVLLGHLGRNLAAKIVGNPAFNRISSDQVQASAAASFFAETGHSLRGEFLAYWTANGGLAQFGYPLSEEFQEKSPYDGKVYTVQYFERNRFEFHPNNQPPYRVLLGQLGRQAAQDRGLSIAAVARPAGVPDYDPVLFFTPTPLPTATATPAPARSDLGAQYVEVNLSEQHLYAWENGTIVFDVAISSGKPGWETPTGIFYVNQRLESQDMTGGNAGSEEYYYTPDVPWIQYFDGNGDAIHGVYWHNNFGITPSSHGCVGAPVWAAKWLYDWGYIGLPIWIHY